MISRLATIFLALLLSCSAAHAVDLNACFENAARRRNISVDLLRAIGHVESRFRPWVTNTESGAIGVMQIMPIHLKWLRKYGIDRDDLYDGCTNINVGAFVLADMIRMFGPTWRASAPTVPGSRRIRSVRGSATRISYAHHSNA